MKNKKNNIKLPNTIETQRDATTKTDLQPLDTNYRLKLNDPLTNTLSRDLKRVAIADPISNKATANIDGILINFLDANLLGNTGVNLANKGLEELAFKNYTGKNKQYSKKEYTVNIPVEEFALTCGKLKPEDLKDTKAKSTKLKNFNRDIRNSIDKLTSKIEFSKNQDYLNTRILAQGGIVENGKTITLTYNPVIADKIIDKGVLTNYPQKLYSMDGRNSNSKALGHFMSLQFWNRENQTKTKLKGFSFDRMYVSTLLRYTSLPTLEEVSTVSKSNRDRRIRTVFERLLNDLIDANILLEWHYKDSNGNLIEKKRIDELIKNNEMLFFQWHELRIFFTMSNYETLLENNEALEYKYNELKEIGFKENKRYKQSS